MIKEAGNRCVELYNYNYTDIIVSLICHSLTVEECKSRICVIPLETTVLTL